MFCMGYNETPTERKVVTKIERYVVVDGKEIKITVAYSEEGLTISKEQQNEVAIEILEFTLVEADAFLDVMKTLLPTHDGGQTY